MVLYGKYNDTKTAEYLRFRTLNGSIMHNYSHKKFDFKFISYRNENV